MTQVDDPGTQGPRGARPLLSVVSPAYDEADGLPALHERLRRALDPTGLDWEWVVVDDHSADRTFAVVADLAREDRRVRGVRLARSLGPHLALTCGLQHARGDCAVVMAADLRDAPAAVPTLLERWRAGDQVVWAVRARPAGAKAGPSIVSRLYYAMMRRIIGIGRMPSAGADFFLIDRRVIDAFGQFKESHTGILALISWMGFRQSAIVYEKPSPAPGRPGWSLRKKINMVLDSVTSFTFLPIRLMTYVGCVTALLGFLYACLIVVNAVSGRRPVQGWSSLMVVVLVLGGIQMLMLGMLGEYLWRALDESRRRPRYLIEATTEATDPPGARSRPGPGIPA